LKKLLISLVVFFIGLKISPHFDVQINNKLEFISSSGFPYRIYYLIISGIFLRARYYFVWIFSEAVCNAAGFGFNGYNEDGSEKWDLLTNIRIHKIETASSMKVLLDNWNIQTSLWLRRVCYDRAPISLRLFLTFSLSAIWHGFYAGFYFTFWMLALCTHTARLIRRRIRPFFQTSAILKYSYDLFTWFVTQLCVAYASLSFFLLDFWPCINYYTYSMNWFLHILVILAFIVVKYLIFPQKIH